MRSIRNTVFILLVLTPSVLAADGILYVDDDGGAAGDGSSWVNAYPFLQDALAEAARSGDVREVRIGPGRYLPDRGESVTTGDRAAAFALRSGLAIRGGFAGLGADDPNVQDPARYVTVLSGDVLGDDGPDFAGNAENVYHVIRAVNVDETARLEGVTIEGGFADGIGNDGRGGGLFILGGAPRVEMCIVRGNRAVAGGGAWLEGSAAALTGVRVDGNAAAVGGGLAIDGGTPAVVDVVLGGNGAVVGGGAHVETASPVFLRVTFDANDADVDGGGMWIEGGAGGYASCIWTGNAAGFDGGGAALVATDAVLADGRFVGNTAESGGGLAVLGGAPLVADTSFRDNAAERGGAAWMSATGATVLGGIVTANTADDGGGFGLDSTQAHLAGVLVSGNLAATGGGIYLVDDAATLDDLTIRDNQATRQGGGLAIEGGQPTVRGSRVEANLVFGSLVSNGGGIFVAGGAILCLDDVDLVANEARFGGGLNVASAEVHAVATRFDSNLGLSGGGAYLSESGVTLASCVFAGNATEPGTNASGGAIYARETGLAADDCAFTNNDAALDGGAVACEGGSAALTACRWSANTAGAFGGALSARDADVVVSSGRMTANVAQRGGAVFQLLGRITLVNCVLGGNRAEGSGPPCTLAGDGGAVNALFGDLALSNCTLFANAAACGGAGGGISAVAVTLDNCILWANTADLADGESAQVAAMTVSVNTSCLEGLTGALGGVGNIGSDPGFVDRLGPDRAPGTGDDDLRLGPASPCVDAGDDRAVPDGVTTDLDGNARFVGTVDMGAYERAPDACATDLDADGVTGLSDLLLVLAAWGGCEAPCAADVDGSGAVGFGDVLLVLSAWGGCG